MQINEMVAKEVANKTIYLVSKHNDNKKCVCIHINHVMVNVSYLIT